MLRYSTGKVVAVLVLTMLGFLFAAPSLFTPAQRDAFIASVPSWIPRALVPHQGIVLGLDLQGGSHVVLEVDTNDLLRTQLNLLRDDVRAILRDERVTAQGGIVVQPRGVQIRIPDGEARNKVLPRLRELSQPIGNPLLGQAGASTIDITADADGLIRLTLSDAGINDRVRRAVDQAIEVLRRRVDALGTTEPNIQREGADRVQVQVPGLQDPQRLKEILGRTAKLEFRFVSETGSGDVENIPSQEIPGQTFPVERQQAVDGADLVDAQPSFDSQTGRPIVNFRFNMRGAQRFGQATTENVGRLMAIVLDNEVISAPRIQTPITGGSGMISGSFTVEQANNLAILLRAGALPAKLTIVEERTVGPGLGQDSIEAGKAAVAVSTVFVVLFMFATYGLFGLIANIALVVHVVFIFALMSLLGATLTLPGIAGIVLTIGTAVDSNVLIYERMREESRAGRSLITALEAGFNRAFATIIDSNSTMLIAALILFFLGSGPVRGFAVVFILGILTTVITAVTMTRMMVALWYRLARPKRLPF
ncbi:preprotein translocase subunit SecD [Pseudochelatococcus lubricantis]|uniref:Protein translocase subunit SecD n=1 Tax=Pseudochelatococcus lubricantis TaxID=1538102 RepID=A0ABX0UY26_9HYPH|nr:protein translocase subunit SecD [Pseudochelatococcus lubricantis]NIJ57818.1 preprotein translocase subunit SecD [Pseudochelatococcus lubricantis]